MPAVKVANFFGGIDIKKNRDELKKTPPQVVVGTPGRIKQVILIKPQPGQCLSVSSCCLATAATEDTVDAMHYPTCSCSRSATLHPPHCGQQSIWRLPSHALSKRAAGEGGRFEDGQRAALHLGRVRQDAGQDGCAHLSD